MWLRMCFFLFWMPVSVGAQTAEFWADTLRVWNFKGKHPELYAHIMESEWSIRGRVLHYGSEPVTFPIKENGLDTVFFRQTLRSKWDTLICRMDRPGKFRFCYNECCGGFFVADSAGKFFQGSVRYQVKNAPKGQFYLGTCGETGMDVLAHPLDSVVDGCRSAMASNIYRVQLLRIQPGGGAENAGVCYYTPGSEELDYSFGYGVEEVPISFLYMPLRREALVVEFDARKRIMRLR